MAISQSSISTEILNRNEKDKEYECSLNYYHGKHSLCQVVELRDIVSIRFSRIAAMETLNEFFCLNVVCCNPSEFIISAFITIPVNIVAEGTMAIAVIDLRVKDFCNFINFFAIDFDWRRCLLDTTRNGVGDCWLQLRNMENGMNVTEISWEFEFIGKRTWVQYDAEGSEILFRKFLGEASGFVVFC